MNVSLVRFTPEPTVVLEKAAAFCYDSEPTHEGKIFKNCIRCGHDSVTEHAMFTFEISGISRACLAQLTRHRIGTAFSVRSQRYCDESAFGFVTPPTIRHDNERAKLYAYAMGEARRAYKKLVEMGVPKEDARFVLPNACETSLAFSINVRALIHLCNLRLCSRAQWEFRDLVAAMVEAVVRVAPDLKTYLVANCERLGYCPEKRGCGKRPTLKQLINKANCDGYYEAIADMERKLKAGNSAKGKESNDEG